MMTGGALRHDVMGDAAMAVGIPEMAATRLPVRGRLPGVSNAIPRTGSYSELVEELKGTGLQANHLNQNAAFRDVIPHEEGLSIGMRGNAFDEVGSPHYEFHSSLEEFWGQYRNAGASFGTRPTNAQYGVALENALVHSGYTPSQAAAIAAEAAAQRAAYGLSPTAPVPRIPGKLPRPQ
jgi:hypothetical protein